jgi:hypothetical protein
MAPTSAASDEEVGQGLFLVLSWVALLAYPAAVYTTWRNTLVDHEMSPAATFGPSVPLAVALAGAGAVFKRVAAGPVLRWQKPAKVAVDRETAKANSERMLSRTWKMVELALLSLVGWYVVRDAPYFPASLGGPGDGASMFTTGRRFVPWRLAAYHAIRFAYLLEWWIFEDGLARPYLTMHHIATSILICCAVFAGLSQFGSIIIFLHDASNVPLQLLVWLQQVRVPSIAIISAWLGNIYLWVHLMLYSFPVEVLVPSFVKEHQDLLEFKIYWAMFLLLMLHHAYVLFRLLSYVPRFLKSPTGAVADAQQAAATKAD